MSLSRTVAAGQAWISKVGSDACKHAFHGPSVRCKKKPASGKAGFLHRVWLDVGGFQQTGRKAIEMQQGRLAEVNLFATGIFRIA